MFKIGQKVKFILSNQDAMILDILKHTAGQIYTAPFDGYLIRLDTLQEMPVREFELEEIKDL